MRKQDFDTFERMQKFKGLLDKLSEHIKNPQQLPNQLGNGGDYAMPLIKNLKYDLEGIIDEYYSKATDIQEEL